MQALIFSKLKKGKKDGRKMREILACKSEKYIYVYVYNNLLSGGINARTILYRDLLFPTTNRSNLIFIKILRDEKLRRAKGYYASCGP